MQAHLDGFVEIFQVEHHSSMEPISDWSWLLHCNKICAAEISLESSADRHGVE